MTEPVAIPGGRHRPWSDWIGVVAYTGFFINLWLASRELGVLMLPGMVHELMIAGAFMIRGRARLTTTRWQPKAIGYAHTFLLLVFLQAASLWRPEWITATTITNARLGGTYLWLVSSVLGLWPLWYLRRSFSLEPEARALVLQGPYRLARHPIYALYIVNYFGLWLRTLSGPFLAVLVLWFILLQFRIRFEERILSAAFPEYRDYQRRVGAFGPRLSRAAA